MADLISSVGRAIEVLQVIARHPDSLGVRDLARLLELPRSTVHRILQTLESSGAVLNVSENRLYRLGPTVVELGFLFVEKLDIRAKARPHMMGLRDLSGETVGLTVRLGDTRAYVELLESDYELRAKPRLGFPYPLYSGAPGRVILAFLPDDEIDRILGRVELVIHTVHTPGSPEAVWQKIRQTRAEGVAHAFEETMHGLNTIAAPVFDHRNEPIGSMSISGPLSRFDKSDMDRVRPDLVRASETVSADLGYRDSR